MSVGVTQLIELTSLHLSGLYFEQFLDVADPLVNLHIYVLNNLSSCLDVERG